jgi:hypothetical protein
MGIHPGSVGVCQKKAAHLVFAGFSLSTLAQFWPIGIAG